MDPVELLICIMVWGFQAGITLLLALFLAGLIWVVEKRARRKNSGKPLQCALRL